MGDNDPNGRILDHIKPEQILVHSGAEEAIFLFMHAVLEPTDHVIVHWPCWINFLSVMRIDLNGSDPELGPSVFRT